MKGRAMKDAEGFTLIELMITVAIIGIIAAVAVPQYSQYIVRGNRAAAQAFLMDVANREKQYLLDARAYTASLTDMTIVTPTDVSKNYTITICIDSAGVACSTASSPPYFNIKATPIVGKPQADNGTLTLDDSGTKLILNAAGVQIGTW